MRIIYFMIGVLVVVLCVPVNVYAQPQSLQHLIDQAGENTVLQLEAGVTYEGPIHISKPIKLQGNGAVLRNTQSKEAALTIESTQNVTICNLHIQQQAGTQREAAIKMKDVHTSLLDAITIQTLHTGIYLQKVRNSTVTNTTIRSTNVGIHAKRGNGIHVYETESLKIEGNTIEQMQDGLYIEQDKNSEIQHNLITKGRYGIHLMYSEGERIRENELNENITGIMAMMSSDLFIIGNRISRNQHVQSSGITIYEVQTSQVQENMIERNRVGIALQKSFGIQLEKNLVKMNQIGLSLLKNDESNEWKFNELIGNVMQIRSDRRASDLSSKDGNYWDDYKGYDSTGDGIGDTPYQPSSTYALLIGSQPAFQYFFEVPATNLMNQLDRSVGTEEELVQDRYPIMSRRMMDGEVIGSPSYRMIGMGILILIGSFLTIRKRGNLE